MYKRLNAFLSSLLCAGVFFASSSFASTSTTTDPPTKTVRVFYILPNDVTLDSAYPKGIGKVMLSSQKYFLQQCGFTFRLNSPICEVVKGTHPRSWYENTANPSGSTDNYWFAVFNGMDDLKQVVPSVAADADRSKWKIVEEVDAEGTGAGGGGGGGEVLLCKHDADGAKGYPADTARWCGGMCHELGHCFGLPDASSTDGTVMSASFYGWPNCIFNSGHISTMKNLSDNSGFWITSLTDVEKSQPAVKTSGCEQLWTLNYVNGKANIEFTMKAAEPVTIGLLDVSGKTVLRPQQYASMAGKNIRSIDVQNIKSGVYLCYLKYEGSTSIKRLIKKD